MLPWFKFFHEFSGDPKVQGMSEAMQRRLVMIFCYHAQGALESLSDPQLARCLGISPKELSETKKLFTDLGFINGSWIPKNWKRRQKWDETVKERMADYRKRKREEKAAKHRNGAVMPAQPKRNRGRNHAVTTP